MTTILTVNETHSEVISQQKIDRKEKWGDGEEKERNTPQTEYLPTEKGRGNEGMEQKNNNNKEQQQK